MLQTRVLFMECKLDILAKVTNRFIFCVNSTKKTKKIIVLLKTIFFLCYN